MEAQSTDSLVRYMFGYEIANGTATVNIEQAKIVNEIFAKYVSGANLREIANHLNELKIECTRDGKWNRDRIRFMLANTRYVAGLLNAPGIVDKDLFDKAQLIIEKNKTDNRYAILTGRIKCGICGSNYGQRINHGKHLWGCPTYKNKGKAFCDSKMIPNDIILDFVNEIMGADNYTADELDDKISLIQANANNTVLFRTADGTEIIKEWAKPSRSESWTAEMKEAARTRATKQSK